ncbi:MAG: PQQ-binding-like beta-propeller repeat protein [Verrucomicrobiota bacterium]
MKIIFLLGFVTAACFTHAGENWPQFRGPTGDGQSDATGLPLRWSESENVKWKTAIPGEGWSSPVVFGEQIWMTTALDGGKSLRAIGVDRNTGKLLRDVEIFPVEAPQFKHALNSYASPTPALETGRVYVHFGTYGTACLNTDTGKILWQNRDLKLQHENGPGSTPILWHDKLIFHCDGMDVRFIVALDKATGKIAWKTERSGEINRPPSRKKAYGTPLLATIHGSDQLISVAADYFYGYEPEGGKELWRLHYDGYSNVAMPVIGDGLIFFSTGFDKAQFWAIHDDAKGEIKSGEVVWKYLKQVPQKPSPIFFDGRIYLVSDNGIATCLDAKTGKELWQERLGGEYSASPVCAEKKIYFFSQEGTSIVLEPGETFKPLATNQLGNGFMASAAIARKAFYLRSKTDLYRVEK